MRAVCACAVPPGIAMPPPVDTTWPQSAIPRPACRQSSPLQRFATIGLLGLGLATGLATRPADAHAVAGDRVFPVTLTMDDPGVADEASLPTFSWQRGAGPSNQYNLEWEYDKTITPTTALIYNGGYSWLENAGAKTQTGFENTVITGKWQAYVNPEHEFLASLGVQVELNGNGETQAVGGDAHGSVSPTLYFGKGLGDLPIRLLRPFAVTGELAYAIPFRRLNTEGDNNGNPPAWNAGVSVQYSLPYLQSQVRSLGLPGFFNHLVPLVETTWSTPAAGPAYGSPVQVTVAPGVIYLSRTFQFGVEALIPGNKASGQNVGVIAQLHFFFDDLFPHSLGAPLFRF